MIQAVIFDLGRVLVDVHVGRLTEFFCKAVGSEDAVGLLPRVMADPLMAQYSTGRIDSRQFYHMLCSQYGLKLSYDEFVRQWCDIFSPVPGIDDVVEVLSKKVQLGLLSDTDPLHWEHIRAHFPLMRYFARPTLSFEIGVMKPGRESYLAAARNTGTEPSECLFIDDLEVNVKGAKDAGMEAIRFEGIEPLGEELKRFGLLCA